MPKSPHKLTARQERFVREYLVDLNATQAAIRAKFSEKGAAVQASNLMAMPKIQKRIEELKQEQFKRVDINADTVLKRLDQVGGVDIAEAYDERGYLLMVHDIPPEVRACIKSIDIFEEFEGAGKDRVKIGEVRRVTFHDKIKANELLGRHLKLFTDKLEIDGAKGLADRLSKAINRKKAK